MEYRITIERIEPNLDYDKQLEEYERRRYGYDGGDPFGSPSRTVTSRALETVISEAAFNAIRKAAVEAL